MDFVLTVTETNKYIKDLMSKDNVLRGLWIKGEISNYKHHYSGHMYFTLKDENSVIKCVMFKNSNMYLKFVPENGMKVIAGGYISVFERDGQYQLYVQEMQPDGLGSLHIAFEQLKRKLEEEGLFDPAHKKKLPFLPRSVGVITSSTGSVIRDIINVTRRRFDGMNIKILPVAVQGTTAAGEVASAIRKLNEQKCVDVIIIARGGGSLEELWAFNEEVVARSIYDSEIPIISAIGHETDFTIADFVADVRAPTPSAAAEIAVPEKQILIQSIDDFRKRLKKSLYRLIEYNRTRLNALKGSAALSQPLNRVYQERMRLDSLNRQMYHGLKLNLEKNMGRFSMLAAKLNALSPLSVVSRGYSIVRDIDGNLIKSINDVNKDQNLIIDVTDGKIDCIVTDKHSSQKGVSTYEKK